MLEVLRGRELSDVVAVVTRWFGGTLLGTGGLSRAYADAVRAALEVTPLVQRVEQELCEVTVDLAAAGRLEHELRSRGTKVTNIDFTSITLNGNAYSPVSTGAVEVWDLTSTKVTGPLTLSVIGTAGSNASYSGTLNLAPVPEPESYAMMLGALGALGFVARRRAA